MITYGTPVKYRTLSLNHTIIKIMRIFRQAFETIGGSKNRNASNDSNRPDSPQHRSSSTNTFNIDKKYQTPDFLFQSPKASVPVIQKRKNSSLTKNFFSQLSQLEAKLVRNKSLEVIETLVQMYQQCVELYDSLQDPIKYYFVDKIQGALADAENWKVIGKNSEDGSDEVFHDIDENLLSQRSQENQKKEDIKPTSARGSLVLKQFSPEKSTLPKEEEDHMRNIQRARSKKVTMNKAVHAESQQTNNNLNNLVTDYLHKTDKAEQIIKETLQTQEESIQDRLRKRRGSHQSQTRQLGHSKTAGFLEAPHKDLAELIHKY